jgi:hypothetical protein
VNQRAHHDNDDLAPPPFPTGPAIPRALVEEMIADAVLAERDACAKVAQVPTETWDTDYVHPWFMPTKCTRNQIEAAIRARTA